MIYYGLPQFGIELDPIPAMIGLSLNTAAYASKPCARPSPRLTKGSGKRRPVSV
jgi:cystine transport system permease protein